MPRSYSSARSRILDAAERVILKAGPRGLSIDAVIAEAQVSKGGFFHHFSSKDALVIALLDRLLEMSEERIAARLRLDERTEGRTVRAQISLAFEMSALEHKRTHALVQALFAALLEGPELAVQARNANKQQLSAAADEGLDIGSALIIQLALDGYYIAETFGTLTFSEKHRRALRDGLLQLLERGLTPKRERRAVKESRGRRGA